MATTSELLFAVQLAVALLIVYDANAYREWMDQRKFFFVLFLVVLLPLAGPLLYIFWVARTEANIVRCPDCGTRLHHENEECPSCDHQRGEVHEEDHDCPVCGTSFETSIGLLKHRRREHGADTDDATAADDSTADDEAAICETCGEAFETERGLHIHQGLKHGDTDEE